MSATTIAKNRRFSVAAVGGRPAMPPFVTLVVIFILSLLLVPNFATMRTISGFVNAASINAIIVIGVTLLMISGEFDLSVGSMMAMGGVIFAKHVMDGGSPVLAIGLALLATALMGTFNGVVTTRTRIPSFIVTLGTRSIYRAIVWVYSGGLMLQTTERLPIYGILNGRLDVVNDLFQQANFRTVTLWAILLGVIFQLVLTRTRFGNHVLATGGDKAAAQAQGVDTDRVKLLSFIIVGVLSGLAGVFTFSQFATIFVASGAGLELSAIAAAVVGGTLLTGGVGSIFGGLVGILLINMLRTTVVLLGLPSDNFEAIVGLAIVGAVVLNEWIRGRE